MLPLPINSNNDTDLEDGFIYDIESPSFGNANEDDNRIVIKKSELICSKANEIVILNTSEQPIYFVSSEEVEKHGVVLDDDDDHRSELAGQYYYKFVDGITVYARDPLIIE